MIEERDEKREGKKHSKPDKARKPIDVDKVCNTDYHLISGGDGFAVGGLIRLGLRWFAAKVAGFGCWREK